MCSALRGLHAWNQIVLVVIQVIVGRCVLPDLHRKRLPAHVDPETQNEKQRHHGYVQQGEAQLLSRTDRCPFLEGAESHEGRNTGRSPEDPGDQIFLPVVLDDGEDGGDACHEHGRSHDVDVTVAFWQQEHHSQASERTAQADLVTELPARTTAPDGKQQHDSDTDACSDHLSAELSLLVEGVREEAICDSPGDPGRTRWARLLTQNRDDVGQEAHEQENSREGLQLFIRERHYSSREGTFN